MLSGLTPELLFSLTVSLFLPTVTWAIRTHYAQRAVENRLAQLEAWRSKAELVEARLEGALHDLRVEITRLQTLQETTHELLRAVQVRLEK